MEQQGTTGLTERQITQFIKDHQVCMHQTAGYSALFTGLLFLFELIDQFDCG